MADWKAIYDRAEDSLLQMLEERRLRREAQQTSSQDTTGTTTTSQEEKPLTAESTADTVRRVAAE